jgi:RNA polymerase sigma-70 factor, ECF subfamily
MKGVEDVNAILGLIKHKAMKSDVALAKEGDKQAFERLILKYRHAMHKVALGMLKNEVDAEEAIHNSVIKAIQGIHKLKNDDFIKTWLIKILICKKRLDTGRFCFYVL